MKHFFIPEPDLLFKNSNKCPDPRIGLLNFGPSGLEETAIEIPIGIIGSHKSIDNTKQFIDYLKYKIEGKYYPNSNVRNYFFPGVSKNNNFGFFFRIRDDYIQEIPDHTIKHIIEKNNRTDRIISFANEIITKMKELKTLNNLKPIILISIPNKILKFCSEIEHNIPKIRLFNSNYNDLKNLAQINVQNRPIFYDLHNYLKVIGYELKLPTQLILPNTLKFIGIDERDPASIAWNFCVSQYYKYQGIPWKLADLSPESLWIGLSFHYDLNRLDNHMIKEAIAQVYMRTGDSQIIKGKEIEVNNEENIGSTHLTEEQSEDILNKAISIYRNNKNINPVRVTLHKTSAYNQDEKEGFLKALDNIKRKDLLYIKQQCDFRVITSTKYPIMRGSVFQRKIKDKDIFNIFTTGYIPCLDTYPGNSVPKPIEVKIEEHDSQIVDLAKDVMNLTKLDWNTTDFNKRLPVTIDVSKKIGDILGELRWRNIEPPLSYCYYM